MLDTRQEVFKLHNRLRKQGKVDEANQLKDAMLKDHDGASKLANIHLVFDMALIGLSLGILWKYKDK